MNFLFDLYGTLLDIKTDEEKEGPWRAAAKLLFEDDFEKIKAEYKKYCKDLAASGSEFAEFDLLLVFERMLSSRKLDKASAGALARAFRLASREKIRNFPCVFEMLIALKEQGAGVYLVSNAQACFTLDEIEECGLTKLFDGILISSDAGVKKPSPEIFEIAFEKFSINREDCIYVGNDLRDDILGAHNAGMRSVYIETEQSGKYDMELPRPDYIVSNHEQMKELLLNLI